MRPDVDPVTGCEVRGTEMIEKYERPDHTASRGRQYPTHNETAQVAFARMNY
jgi:hypothetical protein